MTDLIPGDSYRITGLPDDVAPGDTFRVRLVTGENWGGTCNRLAYVPNPEPTDVARRAVRDVKTMAGAQGDATAAALAALAEVGLAVAGELHEANKQLSSVDDALRNTIGGQPR
jgi:hypothetical protein